MPLFYIYLIHSQLSHRWHVTIETVVSLVVRHSFLRFPSQQKSDLEDSIPPNHPLNVKICAHNPRGRRYVLCSFQ